MTGCQPCNLSPAGFDFLAPAFSRVPASIRRHSSSIVEAGLEPSALDASESTASSSKVIKKLGCNPNAYHQQHQAHNVDFSSYFDPDVPKSPTLTCTDSPAPSFSDADIAHIEARLEAASDEAEMSAAATELFDSPALARERRRLCKSRRQETRQKDRPESTLELNEFFLLHLLKKSYAVTRQSGKKDFRSMDLLVAKNLRLISATVPHDGFSFLFLTRLASGAGSKSADAVLDQLLMIVQRLVAHSSARGLVSTAETASTNRATMSGERSRLLSSTLLKLMQGFSTTGRPYNVQDCFEILVRHSLPVNVFHYQLQVIALFQERTSQLMGKGQIDFEQQSQRIQSKILQIKSSMEANSIALDDTFLATVIFGLSAPLRSPLSNKTSAALASSALQLVRTIFGQFDGMAQGKSLRNMPRFLSALIGAEIDSIQRSSGSSSTVAPPTLSRIRSLIHELNSTFSSCDSPAVGLVEEETVDESRLASIVLQLRLATMLGELDIAFEKLRLLLSIKPIMERGTAEQGRELILKQRGSVISLFSASIRLRQGISGRDAGFEVLDLAFSTQWFDRVWTGICKPVNPSSGFEPKAYYPEATIHRLWKRWLHAWLSDYQTEGMWIRNAESGHRHANEFNLDEDPRNASKKHLKRRTFVGQRPWQILKRGLVLLNKTIDQYEKMHCHDATAVTLPNSVLSTATNQKVGELHTDRADRGSKPPREIAQFASLFKNRHVLDKIVRVTLRGGRPLAYATMATHVEKRLALLVRTLTRVYAPARTWEHVEESMLRHLALIDPEALPTSAVRATMDEIDVRKRTAMLRIPDLVKALDEANKRARTVQAEEPPRETGTIFVLRQMLKKQEQMKAQTSQEKATAGTAGAAFT